MMKNNKKLLMLLKKHYPSARIVLKYENNFELLVAVMLSAQCTDVMVNKVTQKLFSKYRNGSMRKEIVNFATVNIHELEQDIKSTGFYKNKAKNIQASAHILLERLDGKIPKNMEKLLELPGVARKTANVVLGNAYGIVEGIAIDTHVKRVSQRLGLTKQKSPEKIEQELMRLFDRAEWFHLTNLLIAHGRKICDAKRPKCDQCFLSKICPSYPYFSSAFSYINHDSHKRKKYEKT